MAVTRDTSGQRNSASFPSSPTTFSITIGNNADRLLVVWMGGASTGITGITYAGDALTRVANYLFTGGPFGSLWYRIAPATGANNLVISHGGGDTFTCSYYSAYGVDQGTPLDTVASDTTGIDSDTSTPTLPCNSAVNDLIFGAAVLQYASTAWAATGTGSTARWTVGGAGDDSHLPGNVDHDWITLIMDQTAAAGTTDGGFSWTTAVAGVHVRVAIQAAAGATPTAAITGTATANITEADVVTGGKTIIITLTDDTWVTAGGTFDAIRQDIINGIDSAQSEGAGWDAVVKAGLAVTDVVRTSNTVVTVTLPAFGSYDITVQETITVTVPISATDTAVSPIIATPTFTVAAVGGFVPGGQTMENQGLRTILAM